jgi:hypothetical protein
VLRISFIAMGLALLCGLAASAGDLDDLDAEHGFLGLDFGSTPAAIGGLELLSRHGAGGTRLYVRPDDELKLGEVRLDGITYGFHGDELYFVALFTSGRRNTSGALAELQSRYGPGARLPGDAEEYVWLGSKVRLHFRADPSTAMGMIGATSVPIDARIGRRDAAVPARVAP